MPALKAVTLAFLIGLGCAAVGAAQAPTAASNLRLTEQDVSLRVDWTAAQSAPNGYRVRWRPDSGPKGVLMSADVPAGTTSYMITGLTNSVAYFVRVDTKNPDGAEQPVVPDTTISAIATPNPATIRGDFAGSVTEDSRTVSARGTVHIPGNTAATFTEQAASSGTYGTFILTTAGVWIYTLNNADEDTNALGTGDTRIETFMIAASDGTTATITITVNGVDESPFIGGQLTGFVRIGATDNTATGAVVATGCCELVGQTNTSGTYGSFSFEREMGVNRWTYTLDSEDEDTKALEPGNSVADVFVIEFTYIRDGRPRGGTLAYSTSVVITVTRGNIGGTLTGSVTEDDDTADEANGTVTITRGATFTAQTDKVGTYGTFGIKTDGVWKYELDNSKTATNALGAGDEGMDIFPITASDGTTANVVITVTGANDVSVIGSETTGSITEGTATTTGTVTATDPDGDNNVFKTEVSPNDGTTLTTGTGSYGTLTITSAGVWTYTLDNSAGGATDKLNGTEDPRKTDAFTIMAEDGTSGTVTITITGVNDAATIGGAVTGAITEGTATTTGTVTSTDVDGTDNTFKTEVSPTTGTYGSLTITTAGVWTYTLDNSDGGATDMLDGTEDPKKTDAFTIMAEDGTEATVTITVTGVNDDATIGGTVTGSITEGTATTTGTVTATDPDGDGANTFKTEVSPATGTYGSLTITSAGVWTYTLDNSAGGATDKLNGTEAPKKTDAFTIMAADGTSGTVTITITGVNDAATIGGAVTGAITEGTATTTGTVTSTDVDGTDNAFKTEVSPTTGTYGSLTITTAGAWTYTLDNSDGGATDMLDGTEDPKKTDVFTIMAADGTSGTVTITVTGVNDDATIGGTVTGAITEGTATTTGTVTSTDGDGANTFKTEVSPATGTYGSLTITSAGVWTYTLDNSAGGATDKLNGTEAPKKTDAFTIMAADGTSGTVTITITGVNDAATIGGAVTGAITEGTATTTGTVTSTDVDGTDNAFKTEVSPTTGTYGSLTITTAGVWTYTLDNSDGGATDMLDGNEDPKKTDAFTIMAADGTSGTVTITVTGVNDDATIGGTVTGSITEGTATTTGTVTATDGDGANTFKTEVSPATGTYGSLTITSAGVWTYTLDNSAGGATDKLNGTEAPKKTDAFTIMAEDGTSGTVTITITGVNDAATIGGAVTGAITEGTATTTGTVTSTDVDGDNNAFKTEVSPTTGTYGSLTITTAGVPGPTHWTIVMAGPPICWMEPRTPRRPMSLPSWRRTGPSGTVTITVTGVNDDATIGGAVTGSITEGTATTTGTVTATDGDGGANTFKTEVSPTTGTYGSLTITSAGVWTYTLDNSAGGATDKLNGTEDPRKTDVFTIMAADGTSGTVTITITGVNDAATIGGAVTGAITEGTATTTGTVTSTDVDGTDNAFKTEVSPTTGTYGSLTITTAGAWTYTLDNSDGGATDLLDGTEDPKKTDVFTIMAADGTSGTVTITVTGVNDDATIGGAVTGSITEGTATTTGTVTATDGDGANTFKTEVSPTTGTYGSLTITSAGVWTYTLDNSAGGATDKLNGTEAPRKTDVFTIMAADGTSGTVTITITGVNDAATIGGVMTGAITEGTATTTGTVTSTDVDGTDNVFKTEVSPTTGTYGSLTITTAGAWTYTLDNSDGGATDMLDGTEDPKKTDAFTIMAEDGTEATVTITVTGVNDDAAIGGAVTGSITEGTATTTGTVTSTDGDGANTFKTEVSPTTGTYGSLTITSAGVWTYTLDNSAGGATDKLNGTEAPRKTDAFTIMAADGTSGTVTITITGVNDAATIDGVMTGAITEGTATTTGTVTSTDVDGTDNAFKTEVSPTTGTYGSLTITTAGAWTYTLDNSDGGATDMLDGTEDPKKTDAFTIMAEDGPKRR